MRAARSVFDNGAEVGRTADDEVFSSGLSDVGETDLWFSQLHEQELCSLDAVEGAEEGAEVGVDRPDSPPAVDGLAIDFKKSV